jgi:hypothetical protein
MEIRASYSYQIGRPQVGRNEIMQLEQAIATLPNAKTGEQLTEELVEHFFAPNVYGRKMHIPAGHVIVGKIHNHAHLNVITRGVINVVTEFGSEIYTGPRIWVSEPGTKRAVYALEDTDWLTIHPNFDDTQDLEVLEKYVIAESFEDFDRLRLEAKL